MTPDRLHRDTVGRLANKVRVEGGVTSAVRNISLLSHFLRQRFCELPSGNSKCHLNTAWPLTSYVPYWHYLVRCHFGTTEHLTS